MFKRSTKITALLVAAASIISTVPAMASTKLANKEGTVEKAVAFKDGKYLYQGYRTDDDDKALYYNSGDKDKKLDDADQLVDDLKYSANKFGDNQVTAWDGNDEYIVDLSTGKITDDDTVSDLSTTAKTKLETKLNKTDRYNKPRTSATNVNIESFNKITNNGTFGDVWYEYTATTAGDSYTSKYYGYTNGSGTYIDCSKDANMYVYNGSKMVKVESFGDTETTTDAGANNVTLKGIKSAKTLTQDDKYIYRLVVVEVDGAEKVKEADYNGNYDSSAVTELTYIQKISKAQGDKEKDAYLPKSTESYQIDVNTGSGDVADAYKLLVNSDGTFTGNAVKAVDGALYVLTYDENDEKVKVNKIIFRTSEKLNKYSYDGTKFVKSDDKVDGHIAKKDGDTDTKATDFCFDIDGNVWAIYKGEIKKSSKKADFTTTYTCDRSLDELDVYDENNLIAWDHSGDVYTTVTEGSKAAQDEAEEIVGDNTAKDPVKTGWVQAADGTWTLIDVTGAKVTGWANIGGTWYYMDKSTAVMKTGWVNDGGTWYYCNASGAMQTGWLNDAGTWYYLQSNGAMKTGWLNDNGTWYYLNANGSMAANTTVDGYVLGANGAWIR